MEFSFRACAAEAKLMLDGAQLGGQNIRLSWGHTSNKQVLSLLLFQLFQCFLSVWDIFP